MFTIIPTDPANYRLGVGQQFALWHNNHPLGLTYSNEKADCDWTMPDLIQVKANFKKHSDNAEEQAELYAVDLLVLAGIINWDEVEVVVDDGDSGRQAIRRKLAKLYPNMTVSFASDVLRINTIPTCIPIESIEHTYIGLSGLFDHDKAVDTITAVLKEKLDPLFGERIVEECIDVPKKRKTYTAKEEKDIVKKAKDIVREDKREVEGRGHRAVPSVDPGHGFISSADTGDEG